MQFLKYMDSNTGEQSRVSKYVNGNLAYYEYEKCRRVVVLW
jgi:hypothetical protein